MSFNFFSSNSTQSVWQSLFKIKNVRNCILTYSIPPLTLHHSPFTFHLLTMPTLTQTNPVSPPSPSMPLSARSLALLLHARIQQLESINSYVTCAGYLFLCIGCILIGLFIDNVINYYYPPPVLLQYPVLDADLIQHNLPEFYPQHTYKIESWLL